MQPVDPTRQPDSIAASQLQLDSAGHLRHLLTLAGLDRALLVDLLDRAEQYLSPLGQPAIRNDSLTGITVANLFFEPSTRTRASFELAAKRLNADVLNLDVNTSSRIKGESILDTIYTLQAMQVDVFVVRDASAGIPAFIAGHVAEHVSVLNAGEAEVSHPTQGLLDLLTIRQHKPRFEDLTVTIIGDIAHSRVARSAAQGLRTLNVGELRLVAPPALTPAAQQFPGAVLMDDADAGVSGADVVMALRIQHERITDSTGLPGVEEYHSAYGVNSRRLALAADDALLMHPGPMNRDIEISSKVADGPCSVITQQVTNGVAVRMAVLSAVVETLALR